MPAPPDFIVIPIGDLPRHRPQGEAMSAAELETLRVANARLRDKLLEMAKQCSGCDGEGIVTTFNANTKVGTIEQCGDCIDIREALE
jgi:hypothetical protein